MSRIKPVFLVVIFILLSNSSPAQDTQLEGAVAVSIAKTKDNWVGQQLTLNLDLKTTGFSFSDSYFNLPEISHAFVMQTDSSTVKLSENTDGKTWQILRYPLALFPQKAGQLEIPPIEVRFSGSAGFGQEQRQFELTTEPLKVEIQLPPGAREGEVLITTTSFEMDHQWRPQTNIVRAGDAFTLTVTRSATDISAMLMPPLPEFATDGLSVYPQVPELEDRSVRGSLRGERRDSITWVVEKPGSYKIPGIRFQWWDPENRELKQQVIPGIQFEASGPGNTELTTNSTTRGASTNRAHWWLLALFLAGLAAASAWLKIRSRSQATQGDNEKTRFKALCDACNQHDAQTTYAALYRWLAVVTTAGAESHRPITLEGFANHLQDEELASALLELQRALVAPDPAWRGNRLLTAMKTARSRLRLETKRPSGSGLVLLNPRKTA